MTQDNVSLFIFNTKFHDDNPNEIFDFFLNIDVGY